MRNVVFLSLLLYAAASVVTQATFCERQDHQGNRGIQFADLNGEKVSDVIALFGDPSGKRRKHPRTDRLPRNGTRTGAGIARDLHGQSPKVHLPDTVAPDSTDDVTVPINATK